MDAWQSFEFYLPSSMPKAAVVDELRERVLTVAADRGDFVRDFRVNRLQRLDTGWNRWTVGYLPGPARIGRFQREMTEMRTGTA
ncbi:hypothetical protein [Mycolicibacterium diernhoferi]|uniref:Uncharacterized protein n=1 Tax=Mycolicibacterium diernhoferi TaxID=1801 RepID=A0A1Q4HD96_9MYCO|nr:hypothetical protein [Mycolicibacterium diernhoferi]OJZ65516.1 hypothetical protein BRW64_13290 [Mycolicibacterium diernhoferi]OPE46687.1 hypothetical protein BV510_26035 [Mycolicibacterium diernhoferi]PEG51901.1 hypothetical protein CRI78_24035 [Mycolicibacterium diernhoferi]QYL22256.1 hypothetical protein K0O62_25420 [Mycolicibacterium diernhoferi]